MRVEHGQLVTMSNDDYHSSPGLSSSRLRDFEISPLLYFHKHVLRSIQPEDTTALKVGSVLDALILDQNAVQHMVAVIPETVLNKDGHRKGAAWTEWASAHDGMLLLKYEEWDDLRAMADSVWACPPAVDLLSSSSHQQSLFWQDKHERVGKCRFDGVIPSCGFFDLKTTSEPLQSFHYSVRKYRYLTQLAWYARGFKEMAGFYPDVKRWIVVSKVKPYECMVMEPDGDFDDKAHDHIESLLDRLHSHCQDGAGWHNPKYSSVVPYRIDDFSFGG